MPAPSKDSIQFLLALDDQLSPGLKVAARNYKGFTTQLDRLNRKANTSVSRTFGSMGSLTKAFNGLPRTAAQAYTRAYDAMKRKVKPLDQPLRIVFTNRRVIQAFADALSKAMLAAMNKAVAGAQQHAAAPVPASPAPGASTYQQPARGVGPMAAPSRAWLPRGRRAPATTSGMNGLPSALQALLGRGYDLETAGAGTLRNARIGMLGKNAPAQIRNVLAQNKRYIDDLRRAVHAMSDDAQKRFEPAWAKAASDIGKINEEAEKFLRKGEGERGATGGGEGGLGGALGRLTRIQSFSLLLQSFQTFDNLMARMGNPMTAIADTAYDLNRGLHLDNDQLAAMRDNARSMTGAVMTANDMAEAMVALRQAGVGANDDFNNMTNTVALMTKAMDVSAATAAHFDRTLSTMMGRNQAQVQGLGARFARISGVSGQSAESLLGGADRDIENMGAAMVTGTSDEQDRALGNMGALRGALTHRLGAGGAQIADMLSAAIGNPTGPEAINMMRLTGLSSDALLSAISSGNFQPILQGLQNFASKGGGNRARIAGLAQLTGVSASALARLGTSATQTGIMSDLTAMAKPGGPLKELAGQNVSPGQQAANAALSAIQTSTGGIFDWFYTHGGPQLLLAAEAIGGMASTLTAIRGIVGGIGRVMGVAEATAAVAAPAAAGASSLGIGASLRAAAAPLGTIGAAAAVAGLSAYAYKTAPKPKDTSRLTDYQIQQYNEYWKAQNAKSGSYTEYDPVGFYASKMPKNFRSVTPLYGESDIHALSNDARLAADLPPDPAADWKAMQGANKDRAVELLEELVAVMKAIHGGGGGGKLPAGVQSAIDMASPWIRAFTGEKG